MAGIERTRKTTGEDWTPKAGCIRCDSEAQDGFFWMGSQEVVVCSKCVVPLVSAMIFDTIRERHEHVTRELVEEISSAINARLRRISRNLDGGLLDK
jgi:hypothetical protein